MTNSELVRPCERPLTASEAKLVAAALSLSSAAEEFHSQVPRLNVVAESTSSWPILEFSVSGQRASSNAGMRTLADFQYKTGKGLLGYFVYEREGLLAGMECWAIDGQVEPKAWPAADELVPLRAATHNTSLHTDALTRARELNR